jgi:DNA replication protein DnaC
MADFKKICPPEFCQRIDRSILTNSGAFDTLTLWDGRFAGPLASGSTGKGKTRAVWSVLGRLHVKEGKSFAWFTAKRLITEFVKYDQKGFADEFYKYYAAYDLLMVDDLDKVNWQFDSETAALFQFYDWVYRANRPCIATTNCGRKWWADKMGDAFTRRLFDEAHQTVLF